MGSSEVRIVNPAATATDTATADSISDDARAVGIGHPTRFWGELIIVLWLYFLYDIINNFSPVNEVSALRHAESILRVERALRLDIEKSTNAWLVQREFYGSVLANFYNLAHIWITLGIIVFLWLKRRALYADLRNSLVLFNLIGFAVFWMYPVAPPRMLDGFTDVVEQTGAISSFHSGTLAPTANQYAAMPSLHIAWAIWCVVAVYQMLPGRGWRIVAWIHLSLTVVAVVTTANHFVLDLVGGVITALVGFVAARRFATHTRPRIARWRTIRAARAD